MTMHPAIIQFIRRYKLKGKLVRQIEELFSPFLVIGKLPEEEVQTLLNLLEPFDSLLPENLLPENTLPDNTLPESLWEIRSEWHPSPREIVFRKIYNLSVVWLNFELNDNKNPVTAKQFAELDELCMTVPFIYVYFAAANTYRHDFSVLLSECYPQLSDNKIYEIIQDYTDTKLRNSSEFSRFRR